jgi:hypothetical protein
MPWGLSLRLAGTSDIVDGTVVVLALAMDDLVVTSDEGDLWHPASASASDVGQRQLAG